MLFLELRQVVDATLHDDPQAIRLAVTFDVVRRVLFRHVCVVDMGVEANAETRLAGMEGCLQQGQEGAHRLRGRCA